MFLRAKGRLRHLATAALLPGGSATDGQLFILGGAVTDPSPIWNRVITEGGGKEGVHFLVVTAAKSLVSSDFAYYQDILNRLNGVSVDESQWRDGAVDAAQIASVSWDQYHRVPSARGQDEAGAFARPARL